MSEHKSELMKQTALANGWKAEIIPDLSNFNTTGDPDDIVWNLYAMRGLEALHVVFTGDRQTNAVYKYGEHFRTTPARRAPVLKLLTGQPDPARLKGQESAENLLESRSVPWDEDSPAIDILLACLGKEVTWVRRIDGEILSGYIPRESNQRSRNYRVYASKLGDRFLEWTNTEGFHTVRLDAIVSVG